jgi:hypothetical protein
MGIRARMSGSEAGRCGHVLRLLRAANSNIREKMRSAPAAGVEPGPFEAVPRGNSPSLALITGLLVIYPVFASVAIVLAGLWFIDGAGPT